MPYHISGTYLTGRVIRSCYSYYLTAFLFSIFKGSSNSETKVWQVSENTDTIIEFTGHDKIGSERPLRFVISSTPSYGNLIDPDTEQVLNVGDSPVGHSTAPYVQGVEVIYQPENNYFSKPTIQWNGTTIDLPGDQFSYYAVISDNFLTRAQETTEEIEVNNVNDPTEISCPLNTFYVNAIGVGLSGMAGSEVHNNSIQISGFSIEDIDLGLDPVVARVSADFGIITLNADYLSKLDFNSQTYCLGPQNWTCEGSGLSDKSMIFVADPYDIQMALNNMTYKGFDPGVTDYISIILYDGATGNCLENEQFTTTSLRSNCTQTHCRVAVEIQGFDQLGPDMPSTDEEGLLGLKNAPIQLITGGAICSLFLLVIVMRMVHPYMKRVRTKLSSKPKVLRNTPPEDSSSRSLPTAPVSPTETVMSADSMYGNRAFSPPSPSAGPLLGNKGPTNNNLIYDFYSGIGNKDIEL